MVDCGPLSFEFFADDSDESELDDKLFTFEQTEQSSVTFSAYTHPDTIDEDLSDKSGIYAVKFRTFFDHYPDNVLTAKGSFAITVVDPCANLASVLSSAIAD